MKLADLCSFVGYEISEEFLGADGAVKLYLTRTESFPRQCRVCAHEISKIRSHYISRVKHLPIFNYPVQLIFKRGKGYCGHCRKYRSEHVGFISEQSPHLSVAYSYWLSRLCEISSIKEAAEFCGVDDATLWRVDFKTLRARMDQYQIPDVESISVDEVSSRRTSQYEGESRNEKYFTVITDAINKKVVWISDSRNKEALDEFFKLLGPKRCAKIRVIASDQHPGYRQSIKEYCPRARHVFDKFHLMRHFEDAVNDSRKFIAKLLRPNDRKLSAGKFRFIFLKRASQRTGKEAKHMEEVMKDNKLFIHLELIKERMFVFFRKENSPIQAKNILIEIGEWIQDLGAPPLKRWFKKFVADWPQIVTYFFEKVTSSISEGFNNVIKTLKRKAYGFRNMEYFKLKIMQKIGYLNSRYAKTF
jgi:transposase